MEPIKSSEVAKVVRKVITDLRAEKTAEYARRFDPESVQRREMIRQELHELWPSLPIGKGPVKERKAKKARP